MSLAFSWHRPLGVGSPRSRLPPSLRSICPNWLSPATCHVTPVEPSGLHYPERASANAGEDLNPREPLVGMGNGCAPGRSVPVRLPQDNTIPRPMHIEMSTTRRTSVPYPPELRLPLYLTLSLLRPAPAWFAGPIGHSWRKHAAPGLQTAGSARLLCSLLVSLCSLRVSLSSLAPSRPTAYRLR